MISQPSLLLPSKPSSLASAWLKLSIAALIAAGLFSLLLVLSRTPLIQDYIPWIDFFHTALVVHVNLSVLIWFMSFACLFWSINNQSIHPLLEKLALALAILGTLIIIVSPFTGDGHPLINNYIPVLQQNFFLTGLALFSTGVCIQAARTLLRIHHGFESIGSTVSSISALFTICAYAALAWSYSGLNNELDALTFYEFLFWGFGHILQFTHTSFLLFSWLILLQQAGYQLDYKVSLIRNLFLILLLVLPYACWIYLSEPIVSVEHRDYFTQFMKYGGLLSLPLGVIVIWSILKGKAKTATSICLPCHSALLSSLVLFAAGGLIGFMIHGVNVVIPAHYHGSIVGVTLAFMGVSYYLLPEFGYKKPDWTSAKLQPYLYGGGQLMHILGLAWSGGYGVQRKTAGSAQGLESLPEIVGMALMGLGGLISIMGGILYLVIVLRSMWPGVRHKP